MSILQKILDTYDHVHVFFKYENIGNYHQETSKWCISHSFTDSIAHSHLGRYCHQCRTPEKIRIDIRTPVLRRKRQTVFIPVLFLHTEYMVYHFTFFLLFLYIYGVIFFSNVNLYMYFAYFLQDIVYLMNNVSHINLPSLFRSLCWLPDLYVILSDLYVILSDLYVDLSDLYSLVRK